MDYASNTKLLSFFIETHLIFLTLKDILNLFLTSKTIYRLQTSFPFLLYIGHRCTDYSHPYSKGIRRYFKKLLLRYKNEVSGKIIMQVKILKALETKYVLSRNAILNSSGKYKFQGWENPYTYMRGEDWTVQDWGSHPPKKICFVTSSVQNTLHCDVPVERFLVPGETVQGLMERASFKGGCYISRRWDSIATGEASLMVYDTEGNELFKQTVKVSNEDMPLPRRGLVANYKKIEICFKPSEFKDKIIKFFRLAISGRDEESREGWHGARFCDAYIRCYYNDIEGIPSDLDISRKVDRKLTLEEETNKKKALEEQRKKKQFPKYPKKKIYFEAADF